jgi:hypothetical protein
MEQDQDKLRRRREALKRYLAEMGETGADDAELAPFRQQLAQIEGQIQTMGSAIVAGDNNRVLVDADDQPPEFWLQAYYRCLAAQCSRLPLGVIDVERVRTGSDNAIPLPAVYVDLDVVSAPPRQADSQETDGADAGQAWAWRMARGEGSERTPLLDALLQPAAARAVLLGDAGSGKTTFVNYLTYLLATDAPSLPEQLRGRLPVRLILREVAGPAHPRRRQGGDGGYAVGRIAR